MNIHAYQLLFFGSKKNNNVHMYIHHSVTEKKKSVKSSGTCTPKGLMKQASQHIFTGGVGICFIFLQIAGNLFAL